MIQTAHTLRQVRRAQIDFLLRWARSACVADGRPVTDRFSDLDPIENPDNREWHLLYGGSVLDD